MKTTRHLLFLLSLLVLACSNDDQSADGEQNEVASLEIVDYNPKETFTAEFVTIQVQEIDTTTAVEIFFSDVKSKEVMIEGTNIMARVPSGVSSGIVKIKYNEIEQELGSIEITQELDTVYAYVGDEVSTFNIDDGTLNEFIVELPSEYGEGGVGDVMFTKKYNALYSAYCIQCGQNGGCSCHGKVLNIETGAGFGVLLSGDLWETYNRNVFALTEDKMYYTSYYFEKLSMEPPTDFLIEVDLQTMQSTQIWDFILQGPLNLPSQPVQLDNNKLAGFSNTTYKIFDVNSFQTEAFAVDHPIGSFKKQTDGTLFGINMNANEIVTVDPNSGQILEVIYQNDSEIKNIFYSESTKRYYWIYRQWNGSEYTTTLQIFNPSNGIVTSTDTNPVLSGIFIDD